MTSVYTRRAFKRIPPSVQNITTGSLCMKVESAEEEDEGMEEIIASPPVDIQRLCRMCALPCTKSTSTSLLEPNPTLTYQLLHYFGIMLLPKDEMPTRVCHVCTNELQRWDELKNNVRKSQKYLKQQLENYKKYNQQNNESDLEIFDEDSDIETIIEHDINPSKNIEKEPENYEFDKNITEIFHYQPQSNSQPILVTLDPVVTDLEDPPISITLPKHNCKHCNYNTNNLNEYIEHINIHKNNQIDTTTNNNDNIVKLSKKETQKVLQNRQIRDFSPTNSYRCGLCPLKYNTREKLAGHLQKHCSVNKYIGLIPCPYCKVTVRRISNLILHIEKHIRNPNKKIAHTCTVCNKEFAKYLALKAHMAIHEEYSKFICSYCDMTFNFKCQLSSHIEKHKLESQDDENIVEGEKVPTCSICLQYFDNYHDLLEHINDNHEIITDTVIICGNCKFRCKDIENYLIHITHIHLDKEKDEISSLLQSKTIITCDICLKEFDNLQTKQNHYKKQHKYKKIHDCRFCKEVYTNLDELKKHVSENHNNILITKYLIPKKITNKKIINKSNIVSYDSQIIEAENGYPCGKCEQKFSSAQTFVEHVQTEFDALTHKIIPCGYCGLQYRKIQNLLTHTETHILNPEKEFGYVCKICSHKFNQKTNFRIHMRVHTDFKRFKCKLCDNAYKYKASWKLHIEYSHKDFNGTEEEGLEIEKGLTVAEIEEEAINKISEGISGEVPVEKCTPKKVTTNVEKRKTVSIPKEKPTPSDPLEEHYSCDICNTRYLYSIDLYEHYLDKHYEENQIICVFCSKLFESSELLLIHYDEHSKSKKHFCPVCGKGFKMRHSMAEHVFLHSMDRTFQCDKCVRSYRSRTSLYIHIKRDHDETLKMYMCEYCSRQFTSKTTVKRHINQVHINNLPHQCKTCGKCFLSGIRLREHEYTHTDIKPLHCLKCNKGFISKKHWRNHMRKVCNVPESDIPYTRPRFFHGAAYTDL